MYLCPLISEPFRDFNTIFGTVFHQKAYDDEEVGKKLCNINKLRLDLFIKNANFLENGYEINSGD